MPSIIATKDAARALAKAGKSRSEIIAALDCHWSIAMEGMRWARRDKAERFLALRGATGQGATAAGYVAPELQEGGI